jgi:hypothetical protein
MGVQTRTHRCLCGHLADVVKVTDREFDVVCPKCGRVFILSWHHDSPPPTFASDDDGRLPLRAEGE